MHTRQTPARTAPRPPTAVGMRSGIGRNGTIGWRRLTLALVLPLLLTSCRGDDGRPGANEVVVFAAASLREVFTEVGRAFEQSHPGTAVTLNFAASSTLAAQIDDGAPVDVFASADLDTMQTAVDSGAVTSDVRIFALNSLAIAVTPGNPRRIRDLGDLASKELIVLLCDPSVPCGRYADRALDSAAVQVRVRSFEPNAKAVVAKVIAGEADAGVVYRTDVLAAAGAVDGVEIAADDQPRIEYAITMVDTSRHAAREFVDFVLSDSGRRILAEHGFVLP